MLRPNERPNEGPNEGPNERGNERPNVLCPNFQDNAGDEVAQCDPL